MPSASPPGADEAARLRAMAPMLRLRSQVLAAIRAWFLERDFIEVDTPLRVATPALEDHIDAVAASGASLRTSPELHMKRLLAAGQTRIFQIGPCFRAGERGALHHPEYTMLEWYRVDAGYTDILADTKSLLAHVAQRTLGGTTLQRNGRRVELMPVWDYRTVSDTFLEFAAWDPVASPDAERFNRDLVEHVEPALSQEMPVVLADYPAEEAALARLKPADPAVAERWELYIAGIELANAYSELTDAVEQRKRFEQCAIRRVGRGQDAYALDEPFLEALAHGLPTCGGAALGIERLLLLLSGATSLDEVLPFREG